MHPTTLPGRGFVSNGADRISRLLFNLRARECSPLANLILTGQTPAFTRATAGAGAIGRDGRYRMPVHSQPRLEAYDLDGDGVRDTVGLAVDPLSVNLILQSDTLATTWTVTGTCTPTNGVATYARRPFSRVADLAGGDCRQTVSGISGDGVKAVAFLVHHDAFVAGVANAGLWDDTAGVWRCLIQYTITAAGVVTAVASIGTLLKVESLGDSVYRIHAQASGVVAANTNIAYANATGGGATLTTVLVSGWQVQNAPVPAALIPTTTAAVTANADDLTAAIGFNSFTEDDDDLTIYAKLARPNHADASGTLGVSPGICALGAGTAPRIGLFFNSSAREIGTLIDTASTDGVTVLAIPAGQTLEVCAQYADLVIGGKTRLDVGSGFNAYSTLATAFSSLGAASLRIGRFTDELGGGLVDLKIARGLFTLQQMREAL